jgi:NDP-sugar pyrophosphorylase family protein
MNHVTPINSVSEYDSSMHAGEVRAIILAGGIGTARCPAMNSYSSLLFPFLDGEPLICHLLNQLRAHGIREVAITVSEDGNRSERLFEALAGIKTAEMTIHRHVDDGNRGAAGAIKELESIFGAGPLLVIHPTVWLDGFELEAMWREHQDRGSTVTMLLEPAARYRSDLDRVELDTLS